MCLSVLEAGKSKIKVLADLVPGESPLPGLQRAAFLLCLHRAERERGRVGGVGGELGGSGLPLYGHSTIMGAPPP